MVQLLPLVKVSSVYLKGTRHELYCHWCCYSICASSQVALDRDSHMARCVAEAVRLRAPGIDMRMAAAELALPCGDGRVVQVHKASHGSFAQARFSLALLALPGACPVS